MKKFSVLLIACLLLITGTVLAGPSAEEKTDDVAVIPETVQHSWYIDNTLGVVGLELRKAVPGLTDKWYNVLPVDISQDGTQTFDLVAANMYFFGTCTVTVSGDEVTVEYSMPDRAYYNLTVSSECMKWFNTMDEITGDFLENPESDMHFGEAVSKKESLHDADTALLFIRNVISYTNPINHEASLVRYYRSTDRMREHIQNANACYELLKTQWEEILAREAALATDSDLATESDLATDSNLATGSDV